MKKSAISYLACACLVLSGFLLGLYLGRGMSSGVEIEILSQPEPTDFASDTQAAISVSEPTTTVSIPTAGRININTATKEQLMTLPGIGEVYAKRIIEYRTLNGPFKTISDITKVEGIGTKRFESIMGLITTGG